MSIKIGVYLKYEISEWENEKVGMGQYLSRSSLWRQVSMSRATRRQLSLRTVSIPLQSILSWVSGLVKKSPAYLEWGNGRMRVWKNEGMRVWENEGMRVWENGGMRVWKNGGMRVWENGGMRVWKNEGIGDCVTTNSERLEVWEYGSIKPFLVDKEVWKVHLWKGEKG